MTAGSHQLPQLNGDIWIADGGLETTLVFLEGIELADFAAFPLLDTEEGRATLRRYYESYLAVAARTGMGIVLDTPTWRASPDWGSRLGYDTQRLESLNRESVAFVADLLVDHPTPTVINGAVGPRGDGYMITTTMSVPEAASYHAVQARAFAEAGAGMMTAVTMTYIDEAIGVVQAATAAEIPVAVSFTVETDGRLPSGSELGAAITAVDDATDGAAAYFMVNCAHPTHFADVLSAGGDWIPRIRGIRANASTMSHTELDEATELDRGDPKDLADHYSALRSSLTSLAVVGGCCGTDHEHIDVMATALTASR